MLASATFQALLQVIEGFASGVLQLNQIPEADNENLLFTHHSNIENCQDDVSISNCQTVFLNINLGAELSNLSTVRFHQVTLVFKKFQVQLLVILPVILASPVTCNLSPVLTVDPINTRPIQSTRKWIRCR